MILHMAIPRTTAGIKLLDKLFDLHGLGMHAYIISPLTTSYGRVLALQEKATG